METLIDLQVAADIDRKYFTAFLKGLAGIKYKNLLTKVALANGEEAPEVMELDFLYTNLFNPDVTSADDFNALVESGLRVISDMLEQNMTKDRLEEYLARRIQGSDDTKKAIQQFWRQEQANLLTATRQPCLATQDQGLQDIDWEIQATMAGRKAQGANQQSATIVIHPKQGERFMFEASRKDVSQMLDKLAILDQLI